MPRLRIKERRSDPNNKFFSRKLAPYPEYCFVGAEYNAGHQTFALGLDMQGKVKGLVYRPPLGADTLHAEDRAYWKLMGDVSEVVKVKFSPF